MSTGRTLPFAVDTVLTHQQLADEVGGLEELENLLPASRGGKSKIDREAALQEVLEALRRRTPPIQPGQLSVPSDLHRATIYGTLMRLYRYSMTTGSDTWAELHKLMQSKYDSEVLGMTPELNVGVRGSAYSVAVHRR